jgi:hypothetical protein
MQQISKKKKRALTAGIAVALLAVGGSAFAYWATTGSGTATGSTGTNTAIVVKLTSTVTGLAPGLAAQSLSGNFDNPNASPVYVTAVTATVTGTDKTGCTASDYTIAGTAPVGAQVAAGTGVGSWSGLTIQFNNKPATNQDVCKNAVVSISFSAS